MKKIPMFIYAMAFCLATTRLISQEKYEFMIIEFTTYANKVGISIDGKEFLREDPEWNGQPKSGYNANPLLLKVSKYQDEGWELMSMNSGVTAAANNVSAYYEYYFAHLRRKKG